MFRTGDRVTTAATDVLVLAEGEGNAGGALAVVIVAFMVAAGFLLGACSRSSTGDAGSF